MQTWPALQPSKCLNYRRFALNKFYASGCVVLFDDSHGREPPAEPIWKCEKGKAQGLPFFDARWLTLVVNAQRSFPGYDLAVSLAAGAASGFGFGVLGVP